MTRLKNEVIEDTSKLGEIIDLCKDEKESFLKYARHISEHGNPFERNSYEDGVHDGRKELAEAILKILGLLEE